MDDHGVLMPRRRLSRREVARVRAAWDALWRGRAAAQKQEISEEGEEAGPARPYDGQGGEGDALSQ